MSGHDPMCQTRSDHYPSWCDCPRVRAIRDDTHADLRAQVEGLDYFEDDDGLPMVVRSSVLALLGGDDE